MILVMLGTQNKQFKRLLDSVQKEINNKNIKEEVIVQAGFTKYESKDMQIFDYISSDELKEYIKKSNLIIAHGGVGTIMDGIRAGKKVIAVPRVKEYDEHINDHQIEIVEEFNKLGYIVGLKSPKGLRKGLEKVKELKIKKFDSNNLKFIKLLENYIDS